MEGEASATTSATLGVGQHASHPESSVHVLLSRILGSLLVLALGSDDQDPPLRVCAVDLNRHTAAGVSVAGMVSDVRDVATREENALLVPSWDILCGLLHHNTSERDGVCSSGVEQTLSRNHRLREFLDTYTTDSPVPGTTGTELLVVRNTEASDAPLARHLRQVRAQFRVAEQDRAKEVEKLEAELSQVRLEAEQKAERSDRRTRDAILQEKKGRRRRVELRKEINAYRGRLKALGIPISTVKGEIDGRVAWLAALALDYKRLETHLETEKKRADLAADSEGEYMDLLTRYDAARTSLHEAHSRILELEQQQPQRGACRSGSHVSGSHHCPSDGTSPPRRASPLPGVWTRRSALPHIPTCPAGDSCLSPIVSSSSPNNSPPRSLEGWVGERQWERADVRAALSCARFPAGVTDSPRSSDGGLGEGQPQDCREVMFADFRRNTAETYVGSLAGPVAPSSLNTTASSLVLPLPTARRKSQNDEGTWLPTTPQSVMPRLAPPTQKGTAVPRLALSTQQRGSPRHPGERPRLDMSREDFRRHRTPLTYRDLHHQQSIVQPCLTTRGPARRNDFLHESERPVSRREPLGDAHLRLSSPANGGSGVFLASPLAERLDDSHRKTAAFTASPLTSQQFGHPWSRLQSSPSRPRLHSTHGRAHGGCSGSVNENTYRWW